MSHNARHFAGKADRVVIGRWDYYWMVDERVAAA
jgi:hypothetical protein